MNPLTDTNLPSTLEVHITREDKQTGPFTVAQIRAMLEGGLLSAGDLAWHDGLDGWLPLWRVLGCPPPPPSANPPILPAVVAAYPPGYTAPRQATTGGIRREEAWKIIVLVMVTFGLYGLYLLPHHNDQFARLSRRPRMHFWLLLTLTLVTVGIFGVFYQLWLSASLNKFSEEMGTPGRNPSLCWHVTMLNFVSFTTAFSSAGMAIPFSLFLGGCAFWVIQKELNLYADRS
jgi:hypothetical protein